MTSYPALPESVPQIEILCLEASVYSSLGLIAIQEGTKAGARTAVGHFEKIRDNYDEVGDTKCVALAESNLIMAKATYEGVSAKGNKEKVLENQQKVYNLCVDRLGLEGSIEIGVNLAVTLKGAYRGIEAERLLTKLVAISKRVHGPDHNTTKRAESELLDCKTRYVGIKYGDEINVFQALRYEEDGDKCVAQGPIMEPVRDTQAEQMFTVAASDLMFVFGTPVVCHGSKELSHLNGKIGDLRSWQEETNGRYMIHFEDEDREPSGGRMAEERNIRILFDLPNE